jgi:hypothetical protein
MAFMKPKVEYGTWYVIENFKGNTSIVSSDEFGNKEPTYDEMDAFTQDVVKHAEKKTGWCAKLYAPGFADSTDWTGPFDSVEKALKELCEMHGIDADGEDSF